MEAYEDALGVYRTLGGGEADSKTRDNICALYPLLEGVCEREPGSAASVCRKYLALLGEWAARLRAGVLEKLGDCTTGSAWEVMNKDNYKKTAESYKEALGLIHQDPSSGGFERLSMRRQVTHTRHWRRWNPQTAIRARPLNITTRRSYIFRRMRPRRNMPPREDARQFVPASLRVRGCADDCKKAIAAFWEALKYDESSGDVEGYRETARMLAGLYNSLAESEEGRTAKPLECYAELFCLFTVQTSSLRNMQEAQQGRRVLRRLAETEDRSANLELISLLIKRRFPTMPNPGLRPCGGDGGADIRPSIARSGILPTPGLI
ncbi:MAG: hypothetical protein R3B51_04555 [Thermodesulfobacteriota bacterium]